MDRDNVDAISEALTELFGELQNTIEQYAIYQLMIVLISLISIGLIIDKIMNLKILSNIAVIISILNLLISLILCFKDVKEALVRKFHL